MKSLKDLMSSIDNVITTNDDMEITGELLNQLLKEIAKSTYKSTVTFPADSGLTDAMAHRLLMNKNGVATLTQKTGGQQGVAGVWKFTVESIPTPHVQESYLVSFWDGPLSGSNLAVGNFNFFFDDKAANNSPYPNVPRWRYVQVAPTIQNTILNLLSVAASLKNDFPDEMDDISGYGDASFRITIANYYIGVSPPAGYLSGKNVNIQLLQKAETNFLYSPNYYGTIITGGVQGDKVNLLLTPGDTSVDTAATAQWSISITGQELLDPSVPWGKVMNGFKYPGNLLEAAFNIKYLIDQAGANLNVTVNGADIIVQQTSPSYYAVDMSAIDNNTNWTPYPAGGGDPYNPYSNNPYPYAPVVSGPYGQVSITTGFDLGFAELTPAQIIVDSYIQFPILGVLVGIDGNNALIDASDIVKITTKDASVFSPVFQGQFVGRLYVPGDNGLLEEAIGLSALIAPATGTAVQSNVSGLVKVGETLSTSVNNSSAQQRPLMVYEALEEGDAGANILARRLSLQVNDLLSKKAGKVTKEPIPPTTEKKAAAAAPAVK